MTFVDTLPFSARVVAAILLGFALVFLWFFLRGLAHWSRLAAVRRQLAAAKPTELKAVAAAFSRDRLLRHLWKEYFDTLHPQREFDAERGEYVVRKYRSTVPADAIFSTQVIVDSRLGTEFFKHLPGILTGIGIIGTFYGLIHGLWDFHVSADNTRVQQSLNSLLSGVREAFMVSFSAITLAIATTVLEKLLVTRLYTKVEQISQALDSRFEAGAGEEYLARLVRASESSEKETKILKDALVTELKQVLEGLAERQIREQSQSAQALGARIVDGITTGLNPPLEQMRDAFKAAAGSQVEDVNKLVLNTMSAMTAQIRDIFGDQIGRVNTFQQQTVTALQTAVGRLQELSDKLGATNQTASQEMARQMSQAVANLEARQRVMNEELAKVFESMRASTEQAQSETVAKTQAAVGALTDGVAALVGQLRSQIAEARAHDEERTTALAGQARQTSEQMREVAEQSFTQLNQLTEGIREAVRRMEEVTTGTVDKMNEGANVLYIASSDFAKASASTGELLRKAEALTKSLTDASSSVTGASSTLAAALEDYRKVRDEVGRLATELRASVEAAKKEASLTGDVLSRIEAATRKLADAQRQADAYLDGISGVLGEAHRSFCENVSASLRTGNEAFQTHLTTATNMLAAAIDELNDVLERVPAG